MSLNRIEFANFLCHFGSEKYMLDYLNEIVLPSFTDDDLVRKRGRENPAQYFFYDVHIDVLEKNNANSIVGVSGQFVKNLNLIRTQIFDDEAGLVKDVHSIQTSPSATFLLILNSHQLVYLPRTNQAPTVSEFGSTVQNFLSLKWEEYIDKTYNSRKETNEKITKKALKLLIPHPELDVVPLANPESIEDFINRFEKLRSIDFRLLRPNPTIDAGETFNSVRDILDRLGANSGKISASNGPDGLDKSVAITTIDNAVKSGNQDVTLRGDGIDGAFLSGSNADFKISVPLDSIPPTRIGLVKKMFDVFKSILPNAQRGTGRTEMQAKINELARES